jgi:hypothetical protein
MKDNEELSAIPNKKYQQYFERFKEIDSVDVSQWKTIHLIAYFCRKYQDTYGTSYSWKFNTPAPSKCFEVWQMNVLASKLSSNPTILRDYIDWVFDNIVPQSKRRLTSISFLTKEETLHYYKLNVLFAGQQGSNIDRATIFPATYQAVIKEITNFTIKTYGEMAFLSQVEPRPDNIKVAIQKLIEMGFDPEILKRIV